jgi:hypothetical protein
MLFNRGERMPAIQAWCKSQRLLKSLAFTTPLSSGKRISIEHAGDPDGIFRSNGIEKSPTFRGKSRFKGDRHLQAGHSS